MCDRDRDREDYRDREDWGEAPDATLGWPTEDWGHAEPLAPPTTEPLDLTGER